MILNLDIAALVARESQCQCNSNWKSCAIRWMIVFPSALVSSFQPKKQQAQTI